MTLALLPQDQLNAKLQEWPMYQEFSEDQKTRLVERVGEFRIQSRKEALKVAKDFHLSVTSENEDAFVRDYWSERVATEKAIREQLSPMKKKLEGEAKQRLEKQYKPKEAK
jgi:isochorismate hydrolase